MLNAYAAFGLRLDSALALPELPPADADTPRIALHRSGALAPISGLTRVGAATYAGAADLELWRAGTRWRLTTSDAGSWDVDPDGARLDWYAPPGAREAVARYDLLGRVLPLVLHARGALCVHGSSVAIAGRGAAFVGARGRGKSTLALALLEQGALLAGDDVAPLWPDAGDGAARLGPGAPCARVWPEAAAVLRVAAGAVPSPADPSAKRLLPALPSAQRLTSDVPLGGIYFISPVVADPARPAAERIPIGGARAALALVAHATSARLLAADAGAALVDRAAALVAQVPVWELRLTRDLGRLPEAAATIAAWIGASGAASSRELVRGAA